MRYSESKEKSAELLRLILAHMQQHPAAMNPISYAVWYEHLAGINAGLSRALKARLQAEPQLSNASIDALYQTHIAQAEERAVQRISGDFERVMADMAKTAGNTSLRAGDFGSELDQLSTALVDSQGNDLQHHLQRVQLHTDAMRESATELQTKIDLSQKEIERLRTDLERTREEALRDTLTGVLNRRGFDLEMARLMQTPPSAGVSHSLVMLDIDNFKSINDSRGHLVGDRVLAAVGEVLQHVVEQSKHCAARYGGEEFVLLLPATTIGKAMTVAENVRGLIKAMRLRNRGTQEVVLTVTVSAGVSTLRPGETAEDWIARADAALYQSKQAGRDRVTSLG